MLIFPYYCFRFCLSTSDILEACVCLLAFVERKSCSCLQNYIQTVSCMHVDFLDCDLHFDVGVCITYFFCIISSVFYGGGASACITILPFLGALFAWVPLSVRATSFAMTSPFSWRLKFHGKIFMYFFLVYPSC